MNHKLHLQPQFWEQGIAWIPVNQVRDNLSYQLKKLRNNIQLNGKQKKPSSNFQQKQQKFVIFISQKAIAWQP